MAKRILVRADDLGYSESINYGIAKAVRDGIIRTVGVMPNMPAASHGIGLLAGVPVCYGQHTNICLGRPLSDPAQVASLCQPNGEFKSTQAYRAAAKSGEDFVVLEEAVTEIEAQYRCFVELTGDEPHYFEAHAVESANFEKALQLVAQRHHLDYLPLSLREPVRFRNSLLYIVMDSIFPDYDPSASLKRAALAERADNECSVMICHPGYLDDFTFKTSLITVQRTQEVAMLTAPATKAWLRENEIQVITYDDLR